MTDTDALLQAAEHGARYVYRVGICPRWWTPEDVRQAVMVEAMRQGRPEIGGRRAAVDAIRRVARSRNRYHPPLHGESLAPDEETDVARTYGRAYDLDGVLDLCAAIRRAERHLWPRIQRIGRAVVLEGRDAHDVAVDEGRSHGTVMVYASWYRRAIRIEMGSGQPWPAGAGCCDRDPEPGLDEVLARLVSSVTGG